MRSLSKPLLKKYLDDLNKNNQGITISPTLVSVLRKRFGSKEPCNPALGLKYCNSTAQLKEIYDEITQDYMDIRPTYHPPCAEMKYGSSVREENYYTLRIRVEYAEESYQEVVNLKDFGSEALWSSIGAFVGIFLGYSLMQVPELIFEAWKYAKDRVIINIVP